MFCGRKSHNPVNHLHERALRIVYNDNQSSFENLLRNIVQIFICNRNFKIKNNMSTPMMSELFEKHDLNYDLRPKRDFSLHSVNAVAYGLK